MTYTHHAVTQYMSRTGRHGEDNVLMTLRKSIETAREVTYEEAIDEDFKLIKPYKKDTYLIWHDDNIDEDVCGIVVDGKYLKTVLTKDLYSWCRKSKKIKYDITVRGRVLNE